LKSLIFALFALLLSPSVFAQTAQSCPSGTEDMMNYFVMGYPNRVNNYMGPGNANPVYSTIAPELGSKFATTGQFEWTKSSVGYPWDIKTFDSNYIYDRTTELSWTDPTAFKRFNNDLPMSRRCVPANRAGGSIRVKAGNTSYTSYANCLPTLAQDLGYVVNTISAPTFVNLGVTLGSVKSRFFTYRYSCDSNYENCTYQEVFSLGYGVGLYDWKYYVIQNGTLVLKQESVINQFQAGGVAPYMPCSSSYQ
jgi:hypothetical protein